MSGWLLPGLYTKMALDFRQEQLRALKKMVFDAASRGCRSEILQHLKGARIDQIAEVLSHLSPSPYGYRATPLGIAAAKGFTCVVQLLVEEYGTDVEGSVLLGPRREVLFTALSVAAKRGHLAVVECLLSYGADIDAVNYVSQTALHLACQGRHLPVVELLLKKGARTDIADVNGETCLFLPCRFGKVGMVRLLLEKGANPNHKSLSHSTALHAATAFDSSEVLQLLLDHGATFSEDENHRSPLKEAAFKGSQKCVNLLLKHSSFTRQEKVHALELLGARSAHRDPEKTYRYLFRAMLERWGKGDDILLKPQRRPVPELGNVVESQTLRELRSRRSDHVALQWEALLALERILGSSLSDTGDKFMIFITKFREQGRYRDALGVWMYAWRTFRSVELTREYDSHLYCLLMDMVEDANPPTFTEYLQVLHLIVDEMEVQARADKKNITYTDYAWQFSDSCVSYLSEAFKLADGPEEQEQLRAVTKRLNQAQPSLHHRTTLHIAIRQLERNRASWAGGPHPRSFPAFAAFLVQCGADVNAADLRGNTALHFIVRCTEDKGGCLDDVCSTTQVLLQQAGAHLDVRNREGETPLDVAATDDVATVLQTFCPLPPLICLAAAALVRHDVPLPEGVPTMVLDFIKLHSPGQE